MNHHLKHFASQWLGVAVCALLPVIFTSFVSMPLALGSHPGEAKALAHANWRHMT